MRILVDISNISELGSGVKTRFVSTYPEFLIRNAKWDFVFITSKDYIFPYNIFRNRNFDVITLPVRSDSFFLRRTFLMIFLLSHYLKGKRFNLYDTATLPVLFKLCPTVVTIFDLRYVENSLERSCLKVFLKLAMIKFSLFNADSIITISDSMRREIQAITHSSSIFVVPIPYRTQRVIYEHANSTPDPSKLNKFALYVGHLEARKNLVFLIQGFSMFLRECDRDYKLIICSQGGPEESDVIKAISDYSINGSIIYIKNPSDRDLIHYYKQCSFFIFPPIYEGLGIPLLEAMSFNKIIAASSIRVFREVCGEKAYYFDPKSISDLARVLKQCFSEIDPIPDNYYQVELERFSIGSAVDAMSCVYSSFEN